MNVLLLRGQSTDQGTFGRLVAGGFTCFTGELPWRDNRSSVSCIPEGTYQVVWAASPRLHRFTYRLVEVRQRAGILKHSANLMGDVTLGFKAQLNGCIALGEKLGWMDGQKALLVSAPAVRRFESFMNHEPFILEIHHA